MKTYESCVMRCATCGAAVDIFGHHFMRCPGAALVGRHDAEVVQWARMTRECTRLVVHSEVTGVFSTERQQVAPGQRSRKRADVCASDAGTCGFVARGRRAMEERRDRRTTPRPPVVPDPGLAIGDVAVSDPHAPAYLSAAASRPLGCAERRESAKRARHEEDVRRAGNTFTPLVLETYGAMGPGAEAWFRGCIAVAEIQRPEWLEEGEEASQEWERWARAQLSADWQQRISVTLQRGNARVLRSGILRARAGVGVRVYGHMGGCSLDTGSGD